MIAIKSKEARYLEGILEAATHSGALNQDGLAAANKIYCAIMRKEGREGHILDSMQDPDAKPSDIIRLPEKGFAGWICRHIFKDNCRSEEEEITAMAAMLWGSSIGGGGDAYKMARELYHAHFRLWR